MWIGRSIFAIEGLGRDAESDAEFQTANFFPEAHHSRQYFLIDTDLRPRLPSKAAADGLVVGPIDDEVNLPAPDITCMHLGNVNIESLYRQPYKTLAVLGYHFCLPYGITHFLKRKIYLAADIPSRLPASIVNSVYAPQAID